MDMFLSVLREFIDSLTGEEKDMANAIINYVDYALLSNWCGHGLAIDKIVSINNDGTGITVSGRSIKAENFRGQLIIGMEIFGYANTTHFYKVTQPLTMDIVKELKGRIIDCFEYNVVTNLEIGV